MPADTVIVYVPGAGQALFDQSVETVSRHLASALNGQAATEAFAASEVVDVRLAADWSFRTCTIRDRREPAFEIPVIEANNQDIFSNKLKKSGPTLQFLRLLGFWVTCVPLVTRVLLSTSPPGHPPFTWQHRLYVVGTSALATIALGAVFVALMSFLGIELLPSLKSIPHAVALVALVIGLVPVGDWGRLVAVGMENYGTVRYLMWGENRDRVREYLDAVFAEVVRRYPSSKICTVGYSFGSVLCFDYLFPRQGDRPPGAPRLAALILIGFPYVMFETYRPGYFGRRTWRDGGVAIWMNWYTKDDVLGSRLDDKSVRAMFPGAAADRIPLVNRCVGRQGRRGSKWNPAAEHLLYWDPASAEASDTFAGIAAMATGRVPSS